MREELEQAKVTLHNANDIADIKSNPVVDSVLMPCGPASLDTRQNKRIAK